MELFSRFGYLIMDIKFILQNPIFIPLLNLFSTCAICLTAGVAISSLRTSKKANKLKLLPLLSIYFEGSTLRDRKIQVKNIGNSPAYDIKVEHFLLIWTDIHQIWKLDLKIPGTNVLEAGKDKYFILKGTVDGKDADIKDFLVFHLDPDEEHGRRRTRLVITFRNALDNYFYIEIETGAGGLFVGPAKEINFWSKLYLRKKEISEYIYVFFHKILWKFKKPRPR